MENIIEAKAVCKNLKGSARKARLVLDMIRGRRVADAKNILQFSTKKMAIHVHKLLKSAIANANQSAGKINADEMIVETAFVDKGPQVKRYYTGYKGGMVPRISRSCHITIIIQGNK